MVRFNLIYCNVVTLKFSNTQVLKFNGALVNNVKYNFFTCFNVLLWC